MPSLAPDKGFDIACAKDLKQSLQSMGGVCEIDFSQVDEKWSCYYQTYGFDQISCPSRFSMGQHRLAGFDIAHFYWQVENPKAEVLVLHGLFDHTGLFLDLVEVLLENGFSVRSLDLPGHGLSSGEEAAIEKFAKYAQVIDEFSQKIPNEELPFYAVAQSTGCAALMHYVLVGRGQVFKKIALMAPLIQPHKWPLVRFSYFMLHRFTRWYPRSFMTNSHDASFCDFLKNSDPLQSHKISVKWVGAMRLWIESFSHLSQSDVETLVVQGTGDTTVNWKNNITQIKEKLPNTEVVYIEEAMHHLVKEGDAWQKQVFAAVKGFLN